MANTRLSIAVSLPLGTVIAQAVAYQLRADQLWAEAKAIADAISGGGATPANLEVADVAAGHGATYYSLIQAAKANSDAACSQLSLIDQGIIV